MNDATSETVIRVVIAEDHGIVREGLVALLDALPGMEVVGTAVDGRDAILTVADTTPDVVVMDIQMPVMDGLEATRQIVARHPDTAVVMLTMNEDDDTIRSALRAGARGYLLKGADASEVRRAIRTAAAGGMVFGATLAGRLVELLEGGSRPAAPLFPELSERERSILAAMARGASNVQIAREAFLSEKTVRNLVSSIYAKLGVGDRAAAIVMARDAGMGATPGHD